MFIGLLSITHSAIALAGTSLILGTAEPLPLSLYHPLDVHTLLFSRSS